MATNYIGESHVTIEWLRETLENVSETKSNLLEWSVSKIGVGQGFMSQMLRISLVWETHGKLPSDVVLKITNSRNVTVLVGNEETAKTIRSNMKTAHNTECQAYEFLAQFQNMPTAKIYSWDLFKTDEDSGVIVMEYLKDGILVNTVDGYNFKQLLSIADGLARIHAKSLEHRDSMHKFDVASTRKTFEAIILGAVNDAEHKIKPRLPDFYAKYVEPVIRNFDLQDQLDLLFDSEKKFEMTSVLVHGDFWTNNIMFQRDKNGHPSDELLAFVDFQLARPGSCAQDLSQVLVMCCEAEVRRAHSRTVLECYFARLNHYTQERTVPFTFDRVWETLKRIQQCYAVYYILFIPVIGEMPELGKARDCDKEKNFIRMIDRAARAADDFLAHLL